MLNLAEFNLNSLRDITHVYKVPYNTPVNMFENAPVVRVVNSAPQQPGDGAVDGQQKASGTLQCNVVSVPHYLNRDIS